MPLRDVAPLLVLATALLLSGCLPATRSTLGTARSAATTGSPNSIARSSDASVLDRYSSDRSLEHSRRTVLSEARDWLGTPYVYGGESQHGADCSGFVQSVFSSIGHALPRTSRQQAGVGREIAVDEARAGDLVFFNTSGGGVSHVGIMISTEEFVHASTSRGVIVSRLDEGYYRQRFLFVRRVLD